MFRAMLLIFPIASFLAPPPIQLPKAAEHGKSFNNLISALETSMFNFSQTQQKIKDFFDTAAVDLERKMAGMFEQFKLEFEKKFSPEEEEKRFKIFGQNMRHVWQHNKLPKIMYQMGINEFSHLTDSEFKSQYLQQSLPLKLNEPGTAPPVTLGSAVPQETNPSDLLTGSGRLLGSKKLGSRARSLQSSNLSPEAQKLLSEIPPKLDWTLKGKITPVKHQRTCQGCYVFSAIAALESAAAIRYNVTMQMAEQEIIDCSFSFKNGGCVGGQPEFVYDYIIANGINLQSNYPFIAKEGQCKAPTFKGVFKKLTKFFKPEPNVLSILQYLQYGPVVVNHYVPDDFKYYFQGIFATSDCYHQTTINHSAIIVGYDLDTPNPFFRLKNSWGLKWGESGFYKVLIGDLTKENPGFCFLANNGYNAFPTLFDV